MRHMLTAIMGGALVLLFSTSGIAEAREQGPFGAESREEVELILEGVVVSSNPTSSVALIRKPGARRGRSIQVGESIYGAKLLEVSDDEALFERDGIHFRLLIGGGRAPAPPVVADLPGASVDNLSETRLPEDDEAEIESWIFKELERSAADARLEKEMPVILAETALVPCVEEGEVQGLEIARLPGGTILSDAGLLPGDVLLSINELPIDGFSALSGLYPRLRSEDEIRVVVERGGQILNLAYNFH